MVRLLKLCFLIAFIFVFTGCATIYKPLSYEEKQHIYTATFDKTLSALLDVLNEENLPIVTIEKESGVITTGFKTVSMRDIMKQDAVISVPVRFFLNILIKTIDLNTTRITINTIVERWGGGPFDPIATWVDISERNTILQDKYFKKINDKLNI